MDDYNKLVEADADSENTPVYESEYRGKVQNRKTELLPEPSLVLTYYPGHTGFQRKMYYEKLERINSSGVLPARLFLGSGNVAAGRSTGQIGLPQSNSCPTKSTVSRSMRCGIFPVP